ncbi:uncharacterized protein TRIADDRAFT_57512 [Trichoplax adhaerens]|uniref:Elongator complex protein 5 n=1 Tax=Trichoplax adhaerens TaxID=10228 RepID=B3RZM9_TRIAD|nr:hypothetical protein TRIADDRAFT_57512 [Trichoplax adhaerens]EDV23868.1 hypothetical protein TRIADDRAFT_57512 [Trichoplax adhaerens]|eukprot:XP_002113394.1 hypothetical protein TRIADDRAFT_57512 [Trichoplax adhaerens]
MVLFLIDISNAASVAVVVDSLSPFLSHNSTNHVCLSLQQLMMPDTNINQEDLKITQIVALLHSDLHDDYEISAMKHIASTTISLCEMSIEDKLKFDDLENTFYFGLCKTNHIKKSGKIINKKEVYGIYNDFVIRIFEYHQTDIKSSTLDKSTSSDPTENLTFNLKLTQSEKQARSRLKLPYTYSDERKAAELSQPTASSGGKIFYQPDEVDDFDEEDPDDDLDI